MTLEDLRQKRIAIVGLGVNNENLAQYFGKKNLAYDVVEWQSIAGLSAKLKNYQIIFRTPGLPLLSQPVQGALSAGATIYSQTKLFFDLCPCPIVGITGTKGKGTTASLLYEILKAGGRKVWLAGNIGYDPFEFLDELTSEDLVILELSSFQLQDLHKSPHIAVITNVYSDHLNHHADMEEYARAKGQLLANQGKDDIAILNIRLSPYFFKLGQGKKVTFRRDDALRYYPWKLLGAHNEENIAAAAVAAKELGASEEVIRRTVAEFKPLPHRLNPVGIYKGITIIDDSFSTNAESAIEAMHAFFKEPKILMIGGFDKGLDFTFLGNEILRAKQLRGLVVFGQVTGKILKAVEGYKGKILTGAKNITEILQQALSMAEKGDVIIFSPATSSFDMFKNESDRGEQFVKAVSELK
ncbi:MAG: UDP-N-acetylmuramoyl-L-alanine--D-glutamate ligase [Candidatus Doudnabacteria bacterium]|nr:UDP-N-acetylmuramoyl-L-alanine--D-glutamate ligase [Candidatus Doudnabacteria bacterium]